MIFDLMNYLKDPAYRADIFKKIATENFFTTLSHYVAKKNIQQQLTPLQDLSKKLIMLPADQVFDTSISNLFHNYPIKTKKDPDNWVCMEAIILDVLPHREFFCALEYPVNVRCAHSQVPDEYKKRPYNTDFLHTDIWAGELNSTFNA